MDQLTHTVRRSNFVQNIDFLCLLSGQIHSRCYSLSERCFMVCNVSTGGSGQKFQRLENFIFPWLYDHHTAIQA